MRCDFNIGYCDFYIIFKYYLFHINIQFTNRIAKVLGTDDLFKYVEKYNMTLDPHYTELLGRHSKKAWAQYIGPEVQHLCTVDGLSFLSGMVDIDIDIDINIYIYIYAYYICIIYTYVYV